MSFTPEPEHSLAAYYAQTQPRSGEVVARRSLGTLDAVTIGRYAMTIGAADPSHYDSEAARSAGFADVVAPPNMLAAIAEWGIGTPEADLQPDGTPHDGDMPLGDGELGLRVMGAGEEMELVNPVVAGTELVVETTLEAVTPKQTRSGPCVFVTTLNTFAAAEGTVLNRNRRTVVLRNPLQESSCPSTSKWETRSRRSSTRHGLSVVPLQRGHLEPAPHPLRRALRTRRGPPRSRAALPPAGGAGLALRYRGPGPPVASHEVRLPPTQARVRTGRSCLHRAGDGDRRGHHDPRAHRAAPVRRGGIRRDGVGRNTAEGATK